MTDEGTQYNELGREFTSHESVSHSQEEYVRGTIVHTNTVEGYYSVFKRGMKGIYQHCAEKHLHRYLSEFDFRYSNRVRLGVDDTSAPCWQSKGSSESALPIERLVTERPYGKSRKAKKRAADDDKAQSERFRKTARELDCDESEEAFDKAFKKIVNPRRTSVKS